MDITHSSQYPLIAGQHAGKKVRCTPNIKPAYDKLHAHQHKNHWARIAIKELTALSSGLSEKTNIYVKPTDQCRYDGSFYVFLPGLKATLERRPNDEYILVDLALDAMYFDATSQNDTKMGLYRVEADLDNWQTSLVENGHVLAKDNRTVSISDSGYSSAQKAANKIMPSIVKALGLAAIDIKEGGCDLHFTPGHHRQGGLLRYNAVGQTNTYGSAVLLAKSMGDAQSLTGIKWVADRGGSSVLTQAMRMLADKGVTLNGHTIYLDHATTSPGDAVRLAHQLDLNLGKKAANTGWSPVGAFSQARVASERLAHKRDSYDRHYHTNVWINGITRAAAVTGLAGMGAASLGASIPVVASIATIVTGTSGVVGASGTAYSIGQSLKERITHQFKR
ncbi:hypothetical protein [Marinimicrobium sp. ARAG 43.8]|uniref:hypothetical protein n=1 Tax=Marinimicrobium sp. ARAG 43.8 TaxID=3418719 RepID=UPI003CEE7B28